MDTYIEYLANKLSDLSTGIPDALRIYKYGRSCFLSGDLVGSKKAEILNYLLHSSVIPSESKLDDGVIFGYGGLGIVLHGHCSIASGVMIGSNVTLGGGGAKGKFWIDEIGERKYAPRIQDNCNISTGSKVLGGVEVGSFCIIGANSVVRDNVPNLSVVAGVPSKVINSINLNNCLQYKSLFYSMNQVTDDEYCDLISNLI